VSKRGGDLCVAWDDERGIVKIAGEVVQTGSGSWAYKSVDKCDPGLGRISTRTAGKLSTCGDIRSWSRLGSETLEMHLNRTAKRCILLYGMAFV
jgi:hypothetical protein